mmetsp:Transcript_145467/g.253888  ORF Transcript_145467/g.253888 Transcript_145467/m.253888 type:complete len:332 (-) Transcript_145467:790-1785(-)
MGLLHIDDVEAVCDPRLGIFDTVVEPLSVHGGINVRVQDEVVLGVIDADGTLQIPALKVGRKPQGGRRALLRGGAGGGRCRRRGRRRPHRCVHGPVGAGNVVVHHLVEDQLRMRQALELMADDLRLELGMGLVELLDAVRDEVDGASTRGGGPRGSEEAHVLRLLSCGAGDRWRAGAVWGLGVPPLQELGAHLRGEGRELLQVLLLVLLRGGEGCVLGTVVHVVQTPRPAALQLVGLGFHPTLLQGVRQGPNHLLLMRDGEGGHVVELEEVQHNVQQLFVLLLRVVLRQQLHNVRGAPCGLELLGRLLIGEHVLDEVDGQLLHVHAVALLL